MTITNGYCTLDQLKAELGISPSDGRDNTRLEAAVASASRQLDGHCGRVFWQNASAVARSFTTDDPYCIDVEGDISTVTGLIVKTDTAGTGTFATTLTINTHFIVTPVNAAASTPVWPYTGLELIDGYYAPTRSTSRRPGIQITAKWGWPAVPDAVMKATLIQATQLFKASDAVFGGLQLSPELGGVLRVKATLNPLAAGLVEEYVRLQ